MRKIVCLSAALAAFTLAPVFGQDDAAKQDVVNAIKRFEGAEVCLSGHVSEEQPEEKPAKGVIQHVVINGANANGGGLEFTGDFELLARKGSVVVVSKEEFPGIKILRVGDKSICVQAHEDKPFDLGAFSDAVKHLVDWTALSKAVEDSPKLRVNKKGSETVIRVVLDSDYIPVKTLEEEIAKNVAAGGGKLGGAANMAIQIKGAGPMSPKVVELVASFTLDDSKQIKGIEFALQYSDPMKALFANALKGGGVALGGAGRNGGDEELGKRVTYEFGVAEKPSDRMTEFVRYADGLSKK